MQVWGSVGLQGREDNTRKGRVYKQKPQILEKKQAQEDLELYKKEKKRISREKKKQENIARNVCVVF